MAFLLYDPSSFLLHYSGNTALFKFQNDMLTRKTTQSHESRPLITLFHQQWSLPLPKMLCAHARTHQEAGGLLESVPTPTWLPPP